MNMYILRRLGMIALLAIPLAALFWWGYVSERDYQPDIPDGEEELSTGEPNPYVNETLGFRLLLPAQWENQIVIQENEDNTVDFSLARTKEDGAEETVPAFRIQAKPANEYASNDENCPLVTPEQESLIEGQAAIQPNFMETCSFTHNMWLGKNENFAFQYQPTGVIHNPEEHMALDPSMTQRSDLSLAQDLLLSFEVIQ